MTPLHYACRHNRDEIALFLIREEQERVTKERQEEQDGQPGKKKKKRKGKGQQQDTPSFNMRSIGGRSPVFMTESSKIVEEMVKSFPDLELEDGRGNQLLERGENGLGKLSPSFLDSKCRGGKEALGIFHLFDASSAVFLEVGDRRPQNLHK